MFCDAVCALGLLLGNQLLDTLFFFLDLTQGHDFTISLALFSFNIRMSIGGKGISSGRGQRSAVESALLIVCLSVCDSGLLLTPKKNILLFNPIAMGKLINLILGCGILADQTVSTVSILHFLIIAIDSN